MQIRCSSTRDQEFSAAEDDSTKPDATTTENQTPSDSKTSFGFQSLATLFDPLPWQSRYSSPLPRRSAEHGADPKRTGWQSAGGVGQFESSSPSVKDSSKDTGMTGQGAAHPGPTELRLRETFRQSGQSWGEDRLTPSSYSAHRPRYIGDGELHLAKIYPRKDLADAQKEGKFEAVRYIALKVPRGSPQRGQTDPPGHSVPFPPMFKSNERSGWKRSSRSAEQGPLSGKNDVGHADRPNDSGTFAHGLDSRLDKSSGKNRGQHSSTGGTEQDTKLATELTHVNSAGEVHIVDVGSKANTLRTAIAYTSVRFSNLEPYNLIAKNMNSKGDTLAVARIAGIMAAKRTADIIPLCHPIHITRVEVDLDAFASKPTKRHYSRRFSHAFPCIVIQTLVQCSGPTGVEMEALMAAQAAALTVYDMCKAVDKNMLLQNGHIVYKSGGRRGVWTRKDWAGTMERTWFKTKGLEVPPSA